MRALFAFLVALVIVVLGLPREAVAQAAAAPLPSLELLNAVTVLAGLLGVWLTGVLKKAFGKLDGTVADVDGKIVAAIKPFQPIIALALTSMFAILAPKLPGVELPAGDALAAAPLATIVAVVVRELVRRAADHLRA
jgi:hypothetical protein